MEPKFKKGDLVRKVMGFPFRGVILGPSGCAPNAHNIDGGNCLTFATEDELELVVQKEKSP